MVDGHRQSQFLVVAGPHIHKIPSLQKGGGLLVFGSCAGLARVLPAPGFGAGQLLECIGWELSAIASVVVGGTLLPGGLGSTLAMVADALLPAPVFNILNFENGRGTIGLSANWQLVVRGTFLFVVILLQTRVTRIRKMPG